MVYEWKVPKYPLPAQEAGEELERMEHKHGALTPAIVLEESRPTDSRLHNLFEWEDSAAAEHYRLMQARAILNNIVVVKIQQVTPPEPVRAYVNILPEDPAGERRYISMAKVLTTASYKQQMLHAALRDLMILRNKYRVLTELADVFALIETLHKQYENSSPNV